MGICYLEATIWCPWYDNYISCVFDWWSKEMQVSLNKFDVTKKLIMPKVYEELAAHLLLETQATTFFYNF